MEILCMLRPLILLLLLSLASGNNSEVSSEDPGPAGLTMDRDLVEAVEALLSRIQSPLSPTDKRGTIPLCGMGDRCAMKFGPRIGKLCDCGRGANCNSYLLKCI